MPDTMFVGKCTFPVSYTGIDSKKGPNLIIEDVISPFDFEEQENYSQYFRLMSVILKPVEQDEYEATKEQ